MEWDFVANTAVDTPEIIPEAYKGLYVEDKANNKWVLADSVKPLAEAYTGTFKKLTEANKQKTSDNQKDAARRHVIKSIAEVLKETGVEVDENNLADIPTAIKSKFTEFLESQKNGKAITLDLEKVRGDFDKRVADVTAKAQQTVATMEGSLAKYLVQSEASKALAEEKVVSGGVDLLMPHIKGKTKIVKDETTGDYSVVVLDETGNARIGSNGNYMTITELVKEMKKAYPSAFQSDKPAGSGKPPGSGNVGNISQPARAEKSSVEKIAAALSKRTG